MTLTRDDPELARPIEDRAQLIDFFRGAETPEEDWLVGTEHEKVGLYRDGFGPVPYEGERGIQALLGTLEREHGFAGLYDEGRLVALERDNASITLEPGGQLELSGPGRSVWRRASLRPCAAIPPRCFRTCRSSWSAWATTGGAASPRC